jgi:hypothetical protein
MKWGITEKDRSYNQANLSSMITCKCIFLGGRLLFWKTTSEKKKPHPAAVLFLLEASLI